MSKAVFSLFVFAVIASPAHAHGTHGKPGSLFESLHLAFHFVHNPLLAIGCLSGLVALACFCLSGMRQRK